MRHVNKPVELNLNWIIYVRDSVALYSRVDVESIVAHVKSPEAPYKCTRDI